MRVVTSFVDLDTPTGPMRTHLHEPEGRGRHPGLILYSEIFQQTEPIRRFGVQLAGHGFVVAVPEVYHADLPPGTVLGYDDAGKETGNRLKNETPLAAFDADARILASALVDRTTGVLGAVGPCLGGHLAIRAGFLPEVRAVVAVCATDVHSSTLGGGDDTIGRFADVTGELLLCWGRQDPHIPLEGRRRIQAALETSGTSYQWHEWNAVHAFTRDEGERYDPEASRQVFALALDLFRAVSASRT